MLPNTATAGTRHKKTPSAVLKSLVSARSNQVLAEGPPTPAKDSSPVKSIQAPLGEIHHNLERVGPTSRASSYQAMNKSRSLHRKSKVDTGIGYPGSDKTKVDTKQTSPKKTKSSTNLATLWGKGKSKQAKTAQPEVVNKENELPAETIASLPPIWAQFSNTEMTTTSKTPINNVRSTEQELNRGQPLAKSPTKRNIPTEQTAAVRSQGVKIPLKDPAEMKADSSSRTFGLLRKTSSSKSIKNCVSESTSRGRESQSTSRPSTADESSSKTSGTTRGQSRVQAAVAAISGKNRDVTSLGNPPKVNSIDVERDFEDMLEARNIAPEVREKMRALDNAIKSDLIRQNTGAASHVEGGSSGSRSSSRPATRTRTNTTESVYQAKPEITEVMEKKPRPRSFTGFALSKGVSSPKKQKQSKTSSHARGKSADLPRSTSTTSLVSVAGSSSFSLFGKAPKPAMPDDFISYLRDHKRPQSVEVGKIQKLRQLLRNETVTWVDEFIAQGGMIELVNLVYYIIDIEWREEHEDNLLHHTLTCLKALTTTSTATQQLEGLQGKLFPALLALLFSSGEQKKGPAEFTTRGLIISLLFASITATPTTDRARILLSCLRDPVPNKDTIGFISEMHRSRPYKLWCGEITNVSKEVFWIFLHSVNIIEYPAPAPEDTPYYVAHFPTSRPPVPAAPYVGSVEWDATIYLATHLDLLNGIMASLDNAEERNQLRAELKDSGLERIMGGTLRMCKEKFYGHVHSGLSIWAGAARADGWDSKDVREGPRRDISKRARSASPKKANQPPVLAMPKLDFQDAKPLSPFAAEKGKSEFDAWL